MRCSLLIASVGAIATSPPLSPEFVAEYQGAPFVLTNETPKVSRSLLISISMGKADYTDNEGVLSLEGTARWKPADPSAPGRPWVAARVTSGEGVTEPTSAAVVLDTTDLPVLLRVDERVGVVCRTGGVCEIPVTVEFEFQDGGIQGAVEMEWKAVASVQISGEDKFPKGYSVTVTER